MLKKLAFITGVLLGTPIPAFAFANGSSFETCSSFGNFTNCHDEAGNTMTCVQNGPYTNCTDNTGHMTTCTQVGDFTNCTDQ